MELVVGIVGVLVAAGTYFLGKRVRETDKREARINGFADDYIDRTRRHVNTGITALTPTGIFRLNDDSEIREALDICERQLGKHPLGSHQDVLATVDLKRFFDFVAANKINLATTSVEETLEKLRKVS